MRNPDGMAPEPHTAQVPPAASSEIPAGLMPFVGFALAVYAAFLAVSKGSKRIQKLFRSTRPPPRHHDVQDSDYPAAYEPRKTGRIVVVDTSLDRVEARLTQLEKEIDDTQNIRTEYERLKVERAALQEERDKLRAALIAQKKNPFEIPTRVEEQNPNLIDDLRRDPRMEPPSIPPKKKR